MTTPIAQGPVDVDVRPDFVIELPDGDERTVKVWFVEKRDDGKWHISITVADRVDPVLQNEVSELRRMVAWNEDRKRDVMTAITMRMPNAALRGRASAACEGPLEGTVMRKE